MPSGNSGLDFIQGGADLGTSLFGTSPTDSSGSGTTKGTATKKGTTKVSEKLDISNAGIDSFIQDILSGNQGLKDIFSSEQNAGIFNSSVSAQASGDLLAKIAGQLAQLTGEKIRKESVNITDTKDIATTSNKENSGTGGLLGTGGLGKPFKKLGVGKVFGGLF